jgi:hypothetical protein
MKFDTVLEKILAHYTSGSYEEEVIKAKKELFGSIAVLEEDSSLYDVHIAQFLDWYIFSRKLSMTDRTPIEEALESGEPQLEKEEQAYLEQLKGARHSIFEFLKIKGADIHIKDLYSGEKLCLKDSPVNAGFSSDEVFEARLLGADGDLQFAKGFCFHPREAKRYIKKQIRKQRKDENTDREGFFLTLLRMRHRFERYTHIKTEFIYSDEPKVKF